MVDGVEYITPRWEPQEEGMMQSSGNFPRLRNQGYQSSRTSNTWRSLLVDTREQTSVEPAHKHKLSRPNFPKGCQSSGLAETGELNVSNGWK